MSKRNRSRSRGQRPRTPAERWLALWLFVALGGTFLMFGGVTPSARVFSHLAVAMALLGAILLPKKYVRTGGVAVTLAAAGGVLMLATLPGLLPIPALFRPLVARGWVERSTAHWWVSLDPQLTISAFFGMAVVTGVGFAVATWAGRGKARTIGWYVIYGFGGFILLLSNWYAGQGYDSWLGPILTQGRRFFFPFVNPNHFGAFLLLIFPFFCGRALSTRDDGIPPWIGTIFACAVVGSAIWAGSTGPLLVLALQALVLLHSERDVPLWAGGVFLALGVAIVVGFDSVYRLSSEGLSHGRLPVWSSSFWLWADHWLLGSGAGTYDIALPSYLTSTIDERWNHAHNDWLEWVAETGVVGLVSLLIAMWLVWPNPRRSGAGGRYALLACAGLALHATIDFPLHIRALPMVAAALLGWRAGVYDVQLKLPMWLFRAVGGGLFVLQIGGVIWEVRTLKIGEARQALHSSSRGSVEASRSLEILRWWSPKDAEVAFEDAIQAVHSGQRERARELMDGIGERYRHDASIQVTVATFYRLIGEPERGLPFIERAIERGPYEWTYWRERALLVEATDPSSAVEAWKKALQAGDPGALRDGWRVLPVGVYWVDVFKERSAESQVRLARFLLTHQERGAAFLAFQNAHRNDPLVFDPEHARLLEEYEPGSALTYLDQAVRFNPTRRSYLLQHARLLEAEQRWPKAKKAWEKLLGDDKEARYRTAWAELHITGPQQALLILNRAEANGEDLSPEAHYLKAKLYAQIGEYGKCVTAISSSGLLDRKRTRRRANKELEACSAER